MAGLKNGEFRNFALVSASGTRAALQADGTGIELLTDGYGRVWTIGAAPAPPFPEFPVRWQNDNMDAAGEASLVLAQEGVLLQANGYVAAPPGVTLYVQLYDEDVTPPITAPFEEIPIVGFSTWAFAPADGWRLAAGLSIALSSTPDVYTAGAGDLLKWNAQGWWDP